LVELKEQMYAEVYESINEHALSGSITDLEAQELKNSIGRNP
jgi:hypothetical protein